MAVPLLLKTHIRPLATSDIPQAAAVCTSAWLDEPINAYLYPGRKRHPKAYLRLYAREMKDEVGDKDDGKTFAAVAEVDGNTDGKEGKEIVGYVYWCFVDGDKGRKKEKRNIITRIKETIKNWEISHKISLILNPAVSFPRYITYGTADTVYFSEDDKEPEPAIHLGYLAVEPKWQGRGIGMQLTREVMRVAEERGLSVVLYSTESWRRIYERAGFRTIGTWCAAKKEGIELRVMRWDPPCKCPAEMDGGLGGEG